MTWSSVKSIIKKWKVPGTTQSLVHNIRPQSGRISRQRKTTPNLEATRNQNSNSKRPTGFYARQKKMCITTISKVIAYIWAVWKRFTRKQPFLKKVLFGVLYKVCTNITQATGERFCCQMKQKYIYIFLGPTSPRNITILIVKHGDGSIGFGTVLLWLALLLQTKRVPSSIPGMAEGLSVLSLHVFPVPVWVSPIVM